MPQLHPRVQTFYPPLLICCVIGRGGGGKSELDSHVQLGRPAPVAQPMPCRLIRSRISQRGPVHASIFN
eukprot:4798102-Pyramimonas_sp.AAC.1